MQEIIKVQNLTKQFNQITAVNNLSFNVFAGDVYGFLGQNGAGKSTTIRMLLTLIQPTSGSIEIFGKKLLNNRNEILKNIGAVIEKPDVYKYLNAYDNIKLFAKLSGIKPTHKQIMNQLEIVGLADRAKDKVATFSQGMKQRVGIGIALIHEPQLIILDEPTNGLDPQGIADIRNLIKQLSTQQGKTVLISSHLLSEIEQIATRVLIIDKGKKIIENSASALFDSSQTIVEMETINTTYAIEQIQRSKWANHIQTYTENRIIIKLDKMQIPDLHADLVELKIKLISLKTRNSLEDYFLQVTTAN
jgi:ABC-type multidrug transport system ATPase subunit